MVFSFEPRSRVKFNLGTDVGSASHPLILTSTISGENAKNLPEISV